MSQPHVELAVTAGPIITSTTSLANVQQFPVTMQVMPSHIIQQQQQLQRQLQQPEIHVISSPKRLHHIMSPQQAQLQPQLAHLQNPIPVQLTYNSQVNMDPMQQLPDLNQEIDTHQVQLSINPAIVNTLPPELTTSTLVNTHSPELTTSTILNTHPPELISTIVNTHPSELTTSTILNTRPPELTSTIVNTYPPELTTSTIVNTRPPELTSTIVDTRPPELTTFTIVNTRPPEPSTSSIVNTHPPEPLTSTIVQKTRKRKKPTSKVWNSHQQHILPKKRLLPSHASLDINPKLKKKTKLKVKLSAMAPKCGAKKRGMHSKLVQTEQSNEELMLELNLTVKTKLKVHVNTMEKEQMKVVLHRLAELQPGLVFDVIVGQLASQRRDIVKRVGSAPTASVNFDEITMKRNGKGYLIQGHLYEGDRHDKEKGRHYLKCHKVKSGCKARARITGNVAVVMPTKKKHNHAPPNIIEMRFWNKAREEATKEEYRKTPVAKIYKIAKAAFLAAAKDDAERELWIANIPSFESLESGMRLKKSKVFTAPINISMLDTSFDTLQEQIASDGAGGGVQSNSQVAMTSQNNLLFNMQSSIFRHPKNTDTTLQVASMSDTRRNDNSNNMPIRMDSNDNVTTSQVFHGGMQTENSFQGNMQMSNEVSMGGNDLAVQSLLAISNQLHHLQPNQMKY